MMIPLATSAVSPSSTSSNSHNNNTVIISTHSTNSSSSSSNNGSGKKLNGNSGHHHHHHHHHHNHKAPILPCSRPALLMFLTVGIVTIVFGLFGLVFWIPSHDDDNVLLYGYKDGSQQQQQQQQPQPLSSYSNEEEGVVTYRRPTLQTLLGDVDSKSTTKRVLVPISNGSEDIETATIIDTLKRFGAQVIVASVASSSSSSSSTHDDDEKKQTPTTSLVHTMMNGMKIIADCTIEDAATAAEEYHAATATKSSGALLWDMIVLPGGMPGAQNLRNSETLMDLLRVQHGTTNHAWIGATCASPGVVLADGGIFHNTTNNNNDDDGGGDEASTVVRVTGYPHAYFNAMIEKRSSAMTLMKDERVVIDARHSVVTSQGPGTSFEFSLTLGEVLYNNGNDGTGTKKRNQIQQEMLILL